MGSLIKKNDTVKMLTGKDKSKTGKVLQVFPSDERVVVEGLNKIIKHTRARKEGEKGQRVEVPGRIHVSNVQFVCPQCGKATRLGRADDEEKKGKRLCKKCGSKV